LTRKCNNNIMFMVGDNKWKKVLIMSYMLNYKQKQ